MDNIKLLDCTLRDGGYLNDWEFKNNNIINIFERLVSAGIDIIETGFINDSYEYSKDKTIFPNTEAVNETYETLNKGSSTVVGMIDFGTCSIENVMDKKDCFLDGIRVIFKKSRMHEAIDYCSQIKAKGYKTFVQAVSITSYNDVELSELISLVNELEPYAFSLVDTYGLLHKGQLRHYFDFACEHLKKSIGIGYHAHNNFQLAYANCIELLQNPPKDRLLVVDGSLFGMGKSAGNTPIELLIMYMNEYMGTSYHNSQVLEAIDTTMLDIRRQVSWGYDFKFFLSASHDCHPNYVNFLMDMRKLSVKSISEILEMIPDDKKLLYDAILIRELYFDYQNNRCDDKEDRSKLLFELGGNRLLILGPGNNVYKQKDKVDECIRKHNPKVISINFIPKGYSVDYVFMSNAKRYVQLSSMLMEQKGRTGLIATSNITGTSDEFDFVLNYSSLLREEALMPDNPLIMLLKLLGECDTDTIFLAGFDGYRETSVPNYVNPNMEYIMSSKMAQRINEDAAAGIKLFDLQEKVTFVTDTLYLSEALKLKG